MGQTVHIPEVNPKASRWPLIFFGVVLLVVFANQIAVFVTDWLWYAHDAQQPEVFKKALATRGTIWSVTFAVCALCLHFNIRKALSLRVLYPSAPENQAQIAAARLLDVFQKHGMKLGSIIAFVLAVLVASPIAAQYEQYWMATAGTSFGVKDPTFGMDIGFFVFRLPWIQTMFSGIQATIFLTTALVAAAYFGLRPLAKAAGAEISQPAMRTHMGILLGLYIATIGGGMWLDRYEAVLSFTGQFTGPGLAAQSGLSAAIYAIIATLLLAVAVIINSKWGRPWVALFYGGAATVVTGLVCFTLIPYITQVSRVNPNRIANETPFAERAIEMTRFAYGLDKFEVKGFEVQDAPTPEEVEASRSTLQNMRLWDPQILASALENIQSLRPFYAFYDVDIDRYEINGEQRMVMLAPRDLNFRGVREESQSWDARTLVYTHGYAMTVSAVNEAADSGRPSFFALDMPPKSLRGFPEITTPQIYFSHYPPGTQEATGFLVMPSQQKEFDHPTDAEEAEISWTGERGTPLTGLNRLAFSLRFSDFSLLVSNAVTRDSRLVFRRNIVDRAQRVYPLLQFDADPYIVTVGGKLYWMLDGYTTTRGVPYSHHLSYQGRDINYVRNSVKIVTDAYSGEMTAYAFDEEEPILKAIRKTFPNLIKSKSEFPAELMPHIRYAEDGFKAQAQILTQYHVTEPRTFLSNEDLWEIPERPAVGSQIAPYYVQIRLPDEERDSFMLILPFTPNGKLNMIGWIGAHCDPDEYGRAVLYKFPKSSQTQGPIQMESTFAADKVIADINRQLNNDQSEIVPGNLLVIPIGSSILYVRPLFLQSKANSIPELKKVILGLQKRVVVGDTYEEALVKLFGESTPDEVADLPDEPEEPTDGETVPPDLIDRIQEALRLLDAADQALRDGDFARYGELQKQAREQLRQAAQ